MSPHSEQGEEKNEGFSLDEELKSLAKIGFLGDAFVEYDIGNSGFEDELMHIFFRYLRYEGRMSKPFFGKESFAKETIFSFSTGFSFVKRKSVWRRGSIESNER